VIWRYDQEDDEIPDVFGELGDLPIFVITAYREVLLMAIPDSDQRSTERRERDEQIAAEPSLPPLELPPDAAPTPMEAHLGQRRRRPFAIAGVVENGLVRPLDPAVKLSEHSRVIIVTSETS
jgi:hypothetical protein